MVIPICSGILLGLSLIFDGYMENIFIIASTIILFYYMTNYKQFYKELFIGFIVSYFLVNIFSIVILKDYINPNIEPYEESNSKEKTAVILLYDGEDKNYNLSERANEVYSEEGIISFLNMTHRLNRYKRYYEKLGSSDFKETADEIAIKLKGKLGKNYIVLNSYLYTNPYFENIIKNIINQGYKEIVVCPMFITQGKDFELFNKRIQNMKLNKMNLNIELTDVLYKSDNLAKSYKNEILGSTNNKQLDIGVLLVGLEDENNLEQDTILREKIKYYIEQEKNTKIQIKLPLLENNKDDIIKSGEQILEFGIDVLHVIIPTCTIDNMHNKSLVENILKELNGPDVKFHYIYPKDKVNILVEEIHTQITLIKNRR